MKRQIGIVAMFLLGAAVGSAFPLALAHTEEECVCVCPDPPPCPVVDSDGDGIPDSIDAEHSQHVDPADAEAIRKALEAIEKAEEQQHSKKSGN